MPLHPKIEEAERKLSDALTELDHFNEFGDAEDQKRIADLVNRLEREALEAHRLYGDGK